MFRKILFNFGLLIFLIAPVYADNQTSSNDAIRQTLIQESIAAYPGSCPCPYNRARNGSRCGKRSAWSRPGGYAPLCYPSDISDTQIKQYKQKHHKQ